MVGRVVKFGEKTIGGIALGPFGGIGATKAEVILSARVIDVRSGTILSSTEGSGDATKGVIAGARLGPLIAAGQFDTTALGRATQDAVKDLIGKMGSPCPKCGELNTTGAKFCKSCGASMSIVANCPKCGKPIPSDAVFCPECGQKI